MLTVPKVLKCQSIVHVMHECLIIERMQLFQSLTAGIKKVSSVEVKNGMSRIYGLGLDHYFIKRPAQVLLVIDVEWLMKKV